MTVDTVVTVTKGETTCFIETEKEGNFFFVEPNMLGGGKLYPTVLKRDNYILALNTVFGNYPKTFESTICDICGEFVFVR